MTIFETMVEQFHPQNEIQRVMAQRESMQNIVLAGLKRNGFFEHAAFYGGTCLRLFHHLPRFSEDMDFSLLHLDSEIHLDNYFQSITDEFKSAGLPVEIVKKDKKIFGRVESAFLKEDTEAYDIRFQTRKTIKIKIELDTNPPLLFSTEQQFVLQPFSFGVRCFTLPDLYAGKMHALVYRNWKTRVKGRDWYDFEWYVRNNVPLDFNHLQERIRVFSNEVLSKEDFMQQLRNRLANTNIDAVKQDVVAFVDNTDELDIWSNDYFLMLADKIRFL